MSVLETAVPAAPAHHRAPSWKLIVVLGAAGALAGLLLVIVYHLTLPAIERHRALVLHDAISEVLKDSQRFTPLYIYKGAIVATLPAGVDGKELPHLYEGFAADGHRVGFAIPSTAPGFQDDIELIVGYDTDTKTVTGFKVLTHRETPGLGAKIDTEPSFRAGFVGKLAPLVGVKAGAGTGDAHQVDMITGATISSRAVVRIIDTAIAADEPLLRAYLAGAATPAATSHATPGDRP